MPAEASSQAGTAWLGGQRRLWAVAGGVLVMLMMPPLVLQSIGAAEDRSAPQLAAPVFTDASVVADAAMPAWTPAFTNPSATLERRYTVQGQSVGLYIGYYRGQGPTRKLVSSSNAFVKSSDRLWAQTDSGNRVVDLGEHSLGVKTARLRRPVSLADTTTLTAWQFYWVNGSLVAGDARAKAWGAWHRLLGRGDDGAVVIVYALEQRPGDADAALAAFLRGHWAAIDAQLRKTRDGD